MTDLPRLARVFDRVDPVSGPGFDPGHERLPADERALVLSYLEAGHVVLATTERMGDVLSPRAGAVVPLSYRTDGQWIWTDSVTYYLREYDLAPDADLLAYVRERGYRPPAVDAVAAGAALSVLTSRQPARPAWTNRGAGR